MSVYDNYEIDTGVGELSVLINRGSEPGATTITAERDASEVGKPGPVTPKHRILDSETEEEEIVTTIGEVRESLG